MTGQPFSCESTPKGSGVISRLLALWPIATYESLSVSVNGCPRMESFIFRLIGWRRFVIVVCVYNSVMSSTNCDEQNSLARRSQHKHWLLGDNVALDFRFVRVNCSRTLLASKNPWSPAMRNLITRLETGSKRFPLSAKYRT